MIAISYRREDSLPIAGRLYDRLEVEFGKANVFMDFDSIPYGVNFRDHIRKTIELADLVIAIIGPNWIGHRNGTNARITDPGDFVRLEIAYALERSVPIIPVLINRTLMPVVDDLPKDLEAIIFLNALALDTGVDFHHHASRLIASIRHLTRETNVQQALEANRESSRAIDESDDVLGAANAPSETFSESPQLNEEQRHHRTPQKVFAGVFVIVVGVVIFYHFGPTRKDIARTVAETRTPIPVLSNSPPNVTTQTKSSPAVKTAPVAARSPYWSAEHPGTGRVEIRSHADGREFEILDAAGKMQSGKTPAVLENVTLGSAKVVFKERGVVGETQETLISEDRLAQVKASRYLLNEAERRLVGKWKLWDRLGSGKKEGQIMFSVADDGQLLAKGTFRVEGTVLEGDKALIGARYIHSGRIDGVTSPELSNGQTAEGHYARMYRNSSGHIYWKMALTGEFHWTVNPGPRMKARGEIPLSIKTTTAEFSLPKPKEAIALWTAKSSGVEIPIDLSPYFEKR